ncbi:MAG: acyltransferase family protein [Ruminococcus sp.]|nr:acyltransferase family protein [Ruminococcus sp.]
MSKPISKYLSRKIKFVSVFAMFAIVFVNSYNYGNGTLMPYSTTKTGVNPAEMFEFFFSNCLFAFAVPIFFIFSGFLFFIKYENSVQGYFRKIQRRIFPLLVPYVIWAILSGIAIILLSYYENFKDLKFIKDNLVGLDRFYVYLINPPAYQLWFLRQVMLLVVLAPIIYLLVKYTKAFILMPFCALWFFNIDYIINSQALFYFSVGASFAIFGKWRNFTKRDNRIQAGFFSTLWVIFSFWNLFLASFTKETIAINFVHKLTEVAGIAGMWLLFDHIVKLMVNKKFFLLASAHLFFVYALHEPLLSISYQLAFLPDSSDSSHFVLYICLPISIIPICLIISMVVRKLLRPVHKLMTGGRNN